jgi:hypothetical protein
VDKEDVPKTPVEEENNCQIQPYVTETVEAEIEFFGLMEKNTHCTLKWYKQKGNRIEEC